MSNVLSSMTAWLLASSEITTLLVARVYPERLPASTTANPTLMPCLTYQLIDDVADISHDNRTTYKARIQIDTWGGSYKSAHTLAEAVHGLMHGYRGAWGDIQVGGVFRKRKSDMSEPDVELFRVSQDFVVNYHE